MEKVDLKTKTALIYNGGQFIELAIRLSRDFGRVLWHSPWSSEFPESQDDMIGVGIPGIERVSDFWSVVDDVEEKYNVDIYIFPFIYDSDIQLHLISLGKRVWGSRNGDELERYRLQANREFEKLDLPRPTMTSVIGINALRNHLKKVNDKFIKISNYRGNFETWHHDNYDLSEPYLDEIEFELGMEKDVFEWIIEDPIDSDSVVEIGYDGYCIDGQFPNETILGYEQKDAGYICHVKNHNEISPLITNFTDRVSDLLKKYEYRNFFHAENRVVSKSLSYEIDTTCRLGTPPGELLMEMISNISEIIWYGAEGIMIQPIWEAKYGIEVMINSAWAQNKWQTIDFPESIRRWVKLRNLAIIDDKYCIIPRHRDADNIGAVISFGKSKEECIETVKKYADQIKGFSIDIKMGCIDKLNEVISKGEKLGIMF